VFIILQLVIVNAAQPDCHLRSINRSTDAATCLYQWRNFKFLVPCKKGAQAPYDIFVTGTFCGKFVVKTWLLHVNIPPHLNCVVALTY